jgi:hypothetical protein
MLRSAAAGTPRQRSWSSRWAVAWVRSVSTAVGWKSKPRFWGGEDVQLEVGLKEVQDGEAGGVLLVRVVEVWGDDGGLFLVERGVGADGLDGGWEL